MQFEDVGLGGFGPGIQAEHIKITVNESEEPFGFPQDGFRSTDAIGGTGRANHQIGETLDGGQRSAEFMRDESQSFGPSPVALDASLQASKGEERPAAGRKSGRR